jgi:hypothetical protein
MNQTNILNEEVLDFGSKSKGIWRAVPKGWGSATSTTWKIFFTTASTVGTLGFYVFADSGNTGSTLAPSSPEPDVVPSCGSTGGCIAPGTITLLGPNVINSVSFTVLNRAGEPGGEMIEGGILNVALWKHDSSTYAGKIYILGMIATANF